MNTPLWLCAACSLVLHGVLVVGWSPGQAGGPGKDRSRSGTLLQVRLAPADPANAAALAQLPIAGPGPAPEHAPSAPAFDDPANDESPTQPLPQIGEADATTPSAGLAVRPLDEYVPRPQLTVAPLPRAGVDFIYPENGPDFGRFVLTVTLYIDESGIVRHVEVAGDAPLPDALREAARGAFSALQFTPGELEGLAVKSRLRYELVYESLAVRDGR